MKHVLFTGATGGLGSLCVKALSETGNWTVFAGGTNGAALADLGRLPNVIPVRLDVTSPESVCEAREIVLAHADRLDAIVNFAGLTGFSSLVEGESVELIEKLLRVNVAGTARVNREFFGMILKGRGRIINCSSESGWTTPQPFAGPYVLSKYAVEGYSDSLRRELMFLHVPVIKIQPGSYDTNLTRQVHAQFDRALLETKHYGELLRRMRPLMEMELGTKNDPGRLVGIVLRAMEAKHPRQRYRVGTGKLILLLELLPERCVDAVYRLLFRFLKAKAR